ncbi:MAG: hypothetical protein ABI128_15090 [Rhodanobacter sp.]
MSGSFRVVKAVFRVVSGDLVPWKSSKLLVSQIDMRGPTERAADGEPTNASDYLVATQLMQITVQSSCRRGMRSIQRSYRWLGQLVQLNVTRVRHRFTKAVLADPLRFQAR